MLIPPKKGPSQTDDLAAFLNEVLASDPEFMRALVSHRPSCNQALADHPTIPVGKAEDGYRTGFLGIVNGYLVSKDEALLAVSLDDAGRIIEFMRL